MANLSPLTFAVIDPGTQGGCVIFKDKNPINAYLFEKEGLHARDFLDWLEVDRINLGVIERPITVPRQGVKSTAKQWTNYGVQLACLQAVCDGVEEVPAQSWSSAIKKDFPGLSAKEAAVKLSLKLYPRFIRHYKRPRCEKFYDSITDCLAIATYLFIKAN